MHKRYLRSLGYSLGRFGGVIAQFALRIVIRRAVLVMTLRNFGIVRTATAVTVEAVLFIIWLAPRFFGKSLPI